MDTARRPARARPAVGSDALSWPTLRLSLFGFIGSVSVGVVGNFAYSYLTKMPAKDIFTRNYPELVSAALLIALFVPCTAGRLRWHRLRRTAGLEGFRATLRESDCMPQELLKLVQLSLDFLGHGGSKWTSEEVLLSEVMERIRINFRCARFLLLHPNYSECTPEKRDRILRSLLRLRVLVEKTNTDYECVQVRLYNHRPLFRLTLVDQHLAVVGHYRVYTSDSGDTPVLLFANGATYGFYSAYQAYFEHEWQHGVPLNEEAWPTIEDLCRQREIS